MNSMQTGYFNCYVREGSLVIRRRKRTNSCRLAISGNQDSMQSFCFFLRVRIIAVLILLVLVSWWGSKVRRSLFLKSQA